MSKPTKGEIEEALIAAGHAHHDYETQYLLGVRDAQWAGWYAAYVLGRLGDFAAPAEVTTWLLSAPAEEDWPLAAANFISNNLSGDINPV